jgi:hypothetical protein
MAAEGSSVEGAGMFDRLFGRRKKRERKTENREAPTRDEAARQTRQAPAEKEAPAKIRKGIYLSALIYVEGEQAPAENFSATAKSALRAALGGEHNGFTITLKKLEARTDIEQEDEPEQGKEGKFEF